MRRRSSTATLKKLLLSLIVVGLLGSVSFKRAYAMYNSDAKNSKASAASGTLVVGDTVYTGAIPNPTAGTLCKSWASPAAGNKNVSCDSLKWTPATGLRFPGQVAVANIAIQNAGSLRASALQLSMPTCTASTTTGAPAYAGTGDPCAGGLDMYVEEKTDASFQTNSRCVFPENVLGTPAADCSTVWVSDTVAGLKGINCWDLGPMNANSTRYFTIAVQFDPTTATNALNGRTASFTLAWHLDGGNQFYVSGYPQNTICSNDTAYTGQ